jgi:miniconductance mechanosensitive channel
MIDEIIGFYKFLGLSYDLTAALAIMHVVLMIFGLAFLAYFITKNYIISYARKTILYKKNVISETIAVYKPFENVAHLVSALTFYSLADLMTSDDSRISWINDSVIFIEEGGVMYATLAVVWFFLAFLNVANGYYEGIKKSHQPSIKGYLQLVKIIIVLTAVVLIVSMLFDKSPMAFLTGLGAASAVIILVFKDTILGFVASVQVASYDLVRIGDWITIKDLNVDGDVEDVSLNTVRIRNFDKTITSIPTAALISHGVQNWRGMTDTKGRRIKRSINIDIKTIKFCDAALLEKLAKVFHLKKYISEKRSEINSYNLKQKTVEGDLNGRALTNIGLFRQYIYNYLRENEHIRNDLTFLIRQLQPGQSGIPIEIYVFTNDTNWVNYENIQSDIFDHLLAALPKFELSAFQVISDSNEYLKSIEKK